MIKINQYQLLIFPIYSLNLFQNFLFIFSENGYLCKFMDIEVRTLNKREVVKGYE